MSAANSIQGTIKSLYTNDFLLSWIESFLLDRKSQNLSKGTIDFYRKKLALFTRYCETRGINCINQISPDDIRLYLLYLEEHGHNPGGVHACYRALRTFLYFWEQEVEPEGWKNPIKKVKAPRVAIGPLEPIDFDDIRAMLATCQGGKFTDVRDKAILLCLLDTGARAQEFLQTDIDDINLVSGVVIIRQGKGRKPRKVFLGKTSRRAVRAYLKHRADNCSAMWISEDKRERLTYSGLRGIIKRRAKYAGVTEPTRHAFRRSFALNLLRAGVDVYSISAMMGHADLQVLKRYLKQTEHDLQSAFIRGGPVDRNFYT